MENRRADRSQPVNNPQLEEAIRAMKQDNNKETRSAMINAAIKAEFLMPATFEMVPPSKAGKERNVLRMETRVGYTVIETADGKPLFPAFTNWEELDKWEGSAEKEAVILSYDQYADMVLSTQSDIKGFVVNPMSDNVMFRKETVASIKKQVDAGKRERAAQKAVREQALKLTEEQKHPKELMEAIAGYLKQKESVYKAYLMLTIRPKGPSYVFVVDMKGDEKEIYNGIARTATPYIEGFQLEYAPFHSETGQSLIRNVAPFYEKETAHTSAKDQGDMSAQEAADQDQEAGKEQEDASKKGFWNKIFGRK